MKNLPILPQPDDETCGPTSLHAVYAHHGLNLDLMEVIRDIPRLEGGGTLAVLLGQDALRRGFEATLYSYNLRVFDPTWKNLSREVLIQKLEEQQSHKHGKRFSVASRGYLDFLKQGGCLHFDDPTPTFFRELFQKNLPVLCGLSATYLYQTARERTRSNGQVVFDDIRGEPSGHFVVLCGGEEDRVCVADPNRDNPFSESLYYEVDIHRLIPSIFMGVMTYDANLLVIAPSNRMES
ncbi:MAG: hypothetical protein KJT03_01660 [Verrucomicrobiae bacterium]|nr:hypothetical protein [Verrucomicrobiae bacterium]